MGSTNPVLASPSGSLAPRTSDPAISTASMTTESPTTSDDVRISGNAAISVAPARIVSVMPAAMSTAAVESLSDAAMNTREMLNV